MRVWAVASLVLLFLLGLWASTQYVAAHLASASDLGPPWFVLGGVRIYAPWGWVVWSPLHEAREPVLFRNASGITTIAALAGAVLAAMFAAAGRRSSRTGHAHGSSRWATTAEIKKAGLLHESGVVLCQTHNATFRTSVDRAGRARTTAGRLGALVRHDGPEHVFCFAPTRSGPGSASSFRPCSVGSHSVLVYDIKEENWAMTAGWRLAV